MCINLASFKDVADNQRPAVNYNVNYSSFYQI